MHSVAVLPHERRRGRRTGKHVRNAEQFSSPTLTRRPNPSRINGGQKGLCSSRRNWFLFNGRILVRSWFARYTFGPPSI